MGQQTENVPAQCQALTRLYLLSYDSGIKRFETLSVCRAFRIKRILQISSPQKKTRQTDFKSIVKSRNNFTVKSSPLDLRLITVKSIMNQEMI